MLALTRKLNEAVLIGNDIVVYVKEIRGNQVKLAIEAPREIAISRISAAEIAKPTPDCIQTELKRDV